MTQPTRYHRGFSFTDFSGATPLAQQPGVRIDAELDGLSHTTDQICDNLALIQRDDGELANRSVGHDQLKVDTDFKGDPGGNVMAVGAFAAITSLTIAAGADLIRTSEYAAGSKVGGAFYIYDVAVDAAFVTAHAGWAVISANGRGYRLDPGQVIRFEMFGAAGNADSSGNGTDDYPAWLKAKDFIHFHRKHVISTYHKPSVPLHLSAGSYYSSQAWDLTDACYEIRGAGSNLQGYSATSIWFAAGQCGIICQSWDTAGVTGTKTNDGVVTGALNSNLRDLNILSKGGTLEAAQHGVVVKCPVLLERVACFYFGGDGIHIFASTPSTGNANGAVLYNCAGISNGMNGLYINGADVNSIKNYGFQAYTNRMFGILEASFLGNTHLGYEPGQNGFQNSGPPWGANGYGTSVHHSGVYYRVRPGQHVAASTTTPGTNSAIWSPIGLTGSPTLLYPDWVSGRAYVSGGALYCGGTGFTQNNNNGSLFQGYFEQDQMPAWADSTQCSSLPGLLQIAPAFYAANGKMCSSKIGSRIPNAAGEMFTVTLGGDPSNDGQYMAVGRAADESTAWTFHMMADGTLKIKEFNSDLWQPYWVNPFGAAVGMTFGFGISIQNSQQFSGTAAPTAGAHTRGQIVWNETPSASGKIGWVCTAAGTPGTWKAFGVIDA